MAMSELCCVCKKNISYIHIEGVGDYCRDCHNKKMLEEFGVKNDFNYAKIIIVSDKSGERHTFKVEHIILGSIVSWDAEEIKGDYTFRLISKITDNGTEVARRFFHKIVDGVNNKSLSVSSFGQTYINDKGNVQVVSREDEYGWHTAMVVDGHVYSPEEFVELFSSVEGFNIQYRVCDASEPLLGKDEYLMSVKITVDELIAELEYIINVYSDNGFMDYKTIPLFDEYFYKYIDKLELFYENKRDEAVVAGKKIIEMLERIENDDDFFPINEVGIVNRIITKYNYE